MWQRYDASQDLTVLFFLNLRVSVIVALMFSGSLELCKSGIASVMGRARQTEARTIGSLLAAEGF